MQELTKRQIITEEQEKQIKRLKDKFVKKKQQIITSFESSYKIEVKNIKDKNGNYINFINSYEFKQMDSNTVNRYFQCVLKIQEKKMYYLQKQNNLQNKIINRLSQEILAKSNIKQIKNITDLLNLELQNQQTIQRMNQQIKKYKCQIDSLKNDQIDKRQQYYLEKINKSIQKLPRQLKKLYFNDKQIDMKVIQVLVIPIILKASYILQNKHNLIIKQKQNLIFLKDSNFTQEKQEKDILKLNLDQKQKQNSSLKSTTQKLTRQNESLKQLIEGQREKSKISFDKCKDKILSLRQERDERFYELELLQKMKNQQIGKLEIDKNQLNIQKQNNIRQIQILHNQLQQVNQKKKKYKLTTTKFTEQAKINLKIIKIIIDKISTAKLFPLQGQNKSIDHQQILDLSITTKLQFFKLNTEKLLEQIQRLRRRIPLQQSQKQHSSSRSVMIGIQPSEQKELSNPQSS